MSGFPSVLVAATLLAAALPAQFTLRPGQVEVLPALSYATDHATVAINRRGDVLVAYNTSKDLGGVATKQVEAVFVPRVAPGQWQIPSLQQVQLLGDPALALLGTTDRCDKPDVVAVGNDFLVVWPRTQVGHPDLPARLELAVFRAGPVGAGTFEVPQPGEGWLVDPSFLPGGAGAMPDLAWMSVDPQHPGVVREGAAVVVYARRESKSGNLENYDLVATAIDAAGSPPQFNGPAPLAQHIPVDTTSGYPGAGGGRVLPDVVQDDQGGLVVAYESFALAARGTPTDEGRIHVRRYEALPAGGFTETDALELQAGAPDQRHRRPNLMASRFDASDTVGLAWPQMAPDGTSTRAHHGVIELLAGGGMQFVDSQLPDHPVFEEGRPVPVHGDNLRACVMDLKDVALGRAEIGFLATQPALGSGILERRGQGPERTALDLGEQLPGSGGVQLMVRVFESFPAGASNERLFIELLAL